MKAFLADLQQLQRNDDLEHEIKVAVTKNSDGDVSVEASMISNIDKGENGTSVYFYCYLYEYRSKRENEALSQRVETLSGQVAAGSVIKARGIRLEAMNSSDKTTDRSSRVVRLITSLSLVENALAPKGPIRVYVRVKNPEGELLVNSYSYTFTLDGEQMQASASREVDYNGNEVEMSIYLNDIPEFHKGIYSVEAYTEQSLLGSAELMLR